MGMMLFAQDSGGDRGQQVIVHMWKRVSARTNLPLYALFSKKNRSWIIIVLSALTV